MSDTDIRQRKARAVTLQCFYEIAADNAQARNVTKDWDYFFYCMECIYAWEDWIAGTREHGLR